MLGNFRILNWLLGIGGALIGGVAGYFAFFFLTRFGLYALVLPGTLVGLGCGLLSGMKSNVLGIACGVAALVVGCYTQWQFATFDADDSLQYFVTHITSLPPTTLVMIALGGLFGFWFGKGRTSGIWLRWGKRVPRT